MLYRSSSDAHDIGPAFAPGLHRFDYLFVLPSLDASFNAGGAVRFHRAAGAAGGSGIAVERQPMFKAGELSDHRLIGRAAITVGVGLSHEILLAEASLRLSARGERLEADSYDAGFSAGQNLWPREVAAVGTVSVSTPVASRACCPTFASDVPSWPRLMILCATPIWLSGSTAA